MRPIDEGMHLLVLFRRLDAAGRLGLVQRLQEQALRRLDGHLPAGFDAANVDHCIVTALTIEKGTARADVKAAAHLLRACAHAVEAPDNFDAEALVSAYVALDAHAVERDAAMQDGRSTGGRNKPAKLPPADELRAEVERLQGTRGVSEADAKGIVRKRYGVAPQSLNRKLKKT